MTHLFFDYVAMVSIFVFKANHGKRLSKSFILVCNLHLSDRHGKSKKKRRQKAIPEENSANHTQENKLMKKKYQRRHYSLQFHRNSITSSKTLNI